MTALWSAGRRSFPSHNPSMEAYMLRAHATIALLALTLAACGGDSGGIDGSTGPDAPVPATPIGTGFREASNR